MTKTLSQSHHHHHHYHPQVCRYLESNPHFVGLCLNDNPLGDEGAFRLARMLEKNEVMVMVVMVVMVVVVVVVACTYAGEK